MSELFETDIARKIKNSRHLHLKILLSRTRIPHAFRAVLGHIDTVANVLFAVSVEFRKERIQAVIDVTMGKGNVTFVLLGYGARPIDRGVPKTLICCALSILSASIKRKILGDGSEPWIDEITFEVRGASPVLTPDAHVRQVKRSQ